MPSMKLENRKSKRDRRVPLPLNVAHKQVKIPPIPNKYNVFAMHSKYQATPPPGPIRTIEEESLLLFNHLRQAQSFDGVPVVPPGKKKLPVPIRLIDITRTGTFMVQLLDDKHLNTLKQLKKDTKFVFGNLAIRNVDARIQREDATKGLLVMVRVGEKVWLRAKILDFNNESVELLTVDYYEIMKVPYESVYYMHKYLHQHPFQIQECHMKGLEKLEGSVLLQIFYDRFIKVIDAGIKLDKNDEMDIKADVDDEDEWEEDQNKTNESTKNLVLKKFKKIGKQDKILVELAIAVAPAEFISLNKLILKSFLFDSLEDYSFTC